MEQQESTQGQGELLAEAPPPTVALAVEQRVATSQETGSLLKPMNTPGALGHYSASQVLYEMDTVNRGSMLLLRSIVINAESKLGDAEQELKTLREQYHNKCLEAAVMSTQLREMQKIKILQNVLITVGGLLDAAAIKLLFEKQQWIQLFGVGLLVLGVVLTFAGWLWPKGLEAKK